METELINEETANEFAEELTNVKRQLSELQAKEIELKEKLKPYLKEHGKIPTSSALVYYGEVKGARKFIRTEVIEYVKEIWGDDFAKQLDDDCTRTGNSHKNVYVKLNRT
jgi:hypothetical protein